MPQRKWPRALQQRPRLPLLRRQQLPLLLLRPPLPRRQQLPLLRQLHLRLAPPLLP